MTQGSWERCREQGCRKRGHAPTYRCDKHKALKKRKIPAPKKPQQPQGTPSIDIHIEYIVRKVLRQEGIID